MIAELSQTTRNIISLGILGVIVLAYAFLFQYLTGIQEKRKKDDDDDDEDSSDSGE